MHFTKMHGLGNDYLYVFGEVPEDIVSLSKKLSDRHFGVGSDGMIFISPSDNADFKMRIFNADGSEAKMCGNGIRCVGKYVYDKGYTDRVNLTIETLSGIKNLDMTTRNGKVSAVQVNMGIATVGEQKSFALNDNTFNYMPVSVGNPHAVIFVPDVSSIPLEEYGPVIEHMPDYPDGVNVEFVELVDSNELRMRVWERGSGITLACGTGACASTAAAVAKGICERNCLITMHLDGGDLHITMLDDNTVIMQGPAETICEGETV